MIKRECGWCGEDLGVKAGEPGAAPTHGICEKCAAAFREQARHLKDERRSKSPPGRHSDFPSNRNGPDLEGLARRADQGDRNAAKRWLKERERKDPGFAQRARAAFDEFFEAAADESAALLGPCGEHVPDDAWVKSSFGEAIVVNDTLVVDGRGERVEDAAAWWRAPPEGYVLIQQDGANGDREIEVDGNPSAIAAAKRLGVPKWAIVAALFVDEHVPRYYFDGGDLSESIPKTIYGDIEIWSRPRRRRRTP